MYIYTVFDYIESQFAYPKLNKCNNLIIKELKKQNYIKVVIFLFKNDLTNGPYIGLELKLFGPN